MERNINYYQQRIMSVKNENLSRVKSEFEQWWTTRVTDMQRALMLNGFSEPREQVHTQLLCRKDYNYYDQYSKLTEIIGPCVRLSLREFAQNKNQGKRLRKAINSLLNYNDRLRAKHKVSDPDSTHDEYHLFASEVMVFLLLHNPTQDIIDRYYHYCNYVSGKPNAKFTVAGILLATVALAFLAGGIALMPQTSLLLAYSQVPASAKMLCALGTVCALSSALSLVIGANSSVSARMARAGRALDLDRWQLAGFAKKEPEKHLPFAAV